MAGRPAQLAAWLESPFFVEGVKPSQLDDGGGSAGDGEPEPESTPTTVTPAPPAPPAPSSTTVTVPRTTLAQPVVRPVLGKPVAVPARPVAGRRFTVSLPVTRSDTGGPLLTGRMECVPSVAGKPIKHADSFRGGKVKLSLVVPETAKGKALKLKLTVDASGGAVGRTYSYTVR
jgi:hypothetical protein